jgi:hypothetical protein
MKVRFLYFKGCPNARPTLDLLKKVLREKEIAAKIEIIEVKSETDAKRYHFLGSPTISQRGFAPLNPQSRIFTAESAENLLLSRNHCG